MLPQLVMLVAAERQRRSEGGFSFVEVHNANDQFRRFVVHYDLLKVGFMRLVVACVVNDIDQVSVFLEIVWSLSLSVVEGVEVVHLSSTGSSVL